MTALLNAWASTLPGDRGELPRPGDECAVLDCPAYLVDGEEVYFVVEHPGATGRGLAVCWRHVDREGAQPYPVPVQRTSDENVVIVGTVDAAWMRAFTVDALATIYELEQLKARWALRDARRSESVVRRPLSEQSTG